METPVRPLTHMNAKRSQIVDDRRVAMNAGAIHNPNTARSRVWRNQAGQGKIAQLLKENCSSERALGNVGFKQTFNTLETQQGNALGPASVSANNQFLTPRCVAIAAAHVARIKGDLIQEHKGGWGPVMLLEVPNEAKHVSTPDFPGTTLQDLGKQVIEVKEKQV